MRARRLIFATAGGEKPPPNVSWREDPVVVVATLRLDVALAGGVVECPLTTEPALLAAHVCKAGALFGVAEGELQLYGKSAGLSPPLTLTLLPYS